MTTPTTTAKQARAVPHAKTLRLTAAYTPDGSGGYVAEVLGGQAIYTQGATIEAARSNLLDVIEVMLESAPQQFPERPIKPEELPPGALTESIFLVMLRA